MRRSARWSRAAARRWQRSSSRARCSRNRARPARTRSNSCCTASGASSRAATCASSRSAVWATCSKRWRMPPQAARAGAGPQGPKRSRWGLRTRVLALLLPCLFVLLVIDNWYTYQAGYQLLQDAHDQALLESASALAERIAPGDDGMITVHEPFDLQAVLEDGGRPRIVLYAALTPLPEPQAPGRAAAASGPVRVLVGAPDLPTPPPDAVHEGGSLRYDANYRGQPLRVVAVARALRDGSGRTYRVLVQAAQDD